MLKNPCNVTFNIKFSDGVWGTSSLFFSKPVIHTYFLCGFNSIFVFPDSDICF